MQTLNSFSSYGCKVMHLSLFMWGRGGFLYCVEKSGQENIWLKHLMACSLPVLNLLLSLFHNLICV